MYRIEYEGISLVEFLALSSYEEVENYAYLKACKLMLEGVGLVSVRSISKC